MGRGRRRARCRRPTCTCWPSGSPACSPRPGSCSSSPARPRTSTASCGWQALGDLASHNPSQTTFAMACRLVEAAPTWQQDRGQGARVLLLALGDGKIAAPDDRIVAWTWQLARAARDHEYRYAGPHVSDGRSLLGALRAASDAGPHRGGGAAGAGRHGGAAGGRSGDPGGGLAAARNRRRAADGEGPGGAVDGPAAAGGGARIEYSGAQPRATAKRAKRKERPSGRDGLVQRRGGRLDAARRAAPPRYGRGRSRSRRRSPCGCATTPMAWWRPGCPRGDPTGAWQLADDSDVGTRPPARCAALPPRVSPLEISVGKLLGDPERGDREARVAVEGAGLVVPLTQERPRCWS